MHHSRQPARAVSNSVRARARKYSTTGSSSGYSTVHVEDPTASTAAAITSSELTSLPAYEPSWRRTGRSSMSSDVRIPSFLIPCSAGQLMDARYKSRQFSRATASDAKAISPAA